MNSTVPGADPGADPSAATPGKPEPEPGQEAALDSSAGHDYFLAVEEVFLGLRGSPLLLSPADYRVARGWFEAGIPLAVVAGALSEIFAKKAETGEEGRRITTLRYCKPAVKKAWEVHRRLRAAGERSEPEPEADLPARLERLATALAATLSATLEDGEAWAERVRTLRGTAREVEEALLRIDEDLLSHLEAGMAPELSREVSVAVDKALARLASLLPEDELAASRRRLARQQLRRHLGLPELSLFAATATEPPEP